MSNLSDRVRAESIAQQQIRSRLAPLLTLVERLFKGMGSLLIATARVFFKSAKLSCS